MTVSESSSNYVYEKSPSLYGGANEYYQAQVPKIVGHAVKMTAKAVEEKKDLEKLFSSLLDHFSTMRQVIAIKTKTKDSSLFGRRRDSVEGINDGYSYTVLSKQYAEYGDKMLKVIQGKLSKMAHDLKGFHKPTYRETSKYMDRRSSIEIEVMDQENLAKKGWNHGVDVLEIASAVGVAKDIKEQMKTLKTKRPELYKHDKMAFFLQAVHNAFSSPKPVCVGSDKMYVGDIENLKSHWVLVTMRLQINNKMYALSQYLTFMYCNYRTDPIERMTGKSKITVIHQDVFLIEDTLKEIAKVFKEVVLCKNTPSRLDDVKKKVALFRYLFAHAMPTNRGSAAIAEWFEMSMYQYLGFSVSHAKNGIVDLEALTSESLQCFVENYKQMTKLTEV